MTQPIEFIGMIHHRHDSEIHPPGPLLFDRGYVRDFAKAAEAATFDRVLVGYFSDGPDGFLLAAYAAAHTERLGFLVTMALMLFALTAGVERKPALHAALFSVGVTALTFAITTPLVSALMTLPEPR